MVRGLAHKATHKGLPNYTRITCVVPFEAVGMVLHYINNAKPMSVDYASITELPFTRNKPRDPTRKATARATHKITRRKHRKSSMKPRENTGTAILLDEFRKHPNTPLTATMLRATYSRAGRPSGSVYTAIATLLKWGTITRTGKGKFAKYILSPSAAKEATQESEGTN